MEQVTDWLLLWEQLVAAQKRFWDLRRKRKAQLDHWKNRARHFDKMVTKRWTKPDTSREFMLAQLKAHADSTVVDIGAGTGAWTLLMARHAAKVTAIEPSDAMCEVMEEKLAAAKITNVAIIRGEWPDVDIDAHDFSFASHSMYGVADFRGFVERMVRVTQKTCFLLMRVLLSKAVMAVAARHVWGQPYDGPNFQVAYNALMQMDIYPNIAMETGTGWDPWIHDSLEAALSDVKMRLGLENDNLHDAFLRSLLEKSLRKEDDKWVWPVGNRSAIAYWDVGRRAAIPALNQLWYTLPPPVTNGNYL